MKITVKGNTNERLEIRADEGLDKAELILKAIRKMSRKLRHLSKNGFEIDLMIKSLNNHQEEYLHQSLFTSPFYRDYTTTEREQPQKGEKMHTETTAYIEKNEVVKKENEAIDKFFKNLEEEGFTVQQVKNIVSRINARITSASIACDIRTPFCTKDTL